jgi:hypothetical protein
MTTGKRLTDFGKREPAQLPPAPGPKRSNHVALLVMGTLAVGGGAYAFMPKQTCEPPAPTAPGMAAPAVPSGCTTRTSSGSGGGGARYSFFSGGSTGSDSSGRGSGSSGTSSGGVTRGGFGSFAHAFGFGGGG